MKFTKGEWRVIYPAMNEPDKFIIDVDGDGIVYAHVYGANGTEEEMIEAEANAKLIAAAPDLLESCISLLADLRQVLINDCLGQDMDEDTGIRYAESFDVVQRAKAAIKKATA